MYLFHRAYTNDVYRRYLVARVDRTVPYISTRFLRMVDLVKCLKIAAQ